MKVFNSLVVAVSLIGAGALLAADKESKLEAQAKVSKADAEKTALAKVPGGKITDSELEEEDGKLIWTFDIAKKGTKDITEVHVDAKTGELIKVEEESADKEAAEKAKDEKEKSEVKEKKGEKKGKDKD
jgi:hypothetical protein